MGKYLRALWYLITGRFQAAAAALQENRYVMEATYDAAIGKKATSANTVKDAVAKLVGMQQRKIDQVNEATTDVQRLEKVKAGAAAKAKDLAARLQAAGKSPDQVKLDPEFIRCQNAYNDASSEAKSRDARIHELEAEIKGNEKAIADYKAQLMTMKRDVESLRQEKVEAVADVQLAKEAQSINDALSGLENSNVDKDLASAREARRTAKARATVSKELAGTNVVAADNEFIHYGEAAGSTSEFDQLIGLGQQTKTLEPSKLPEN